MKRILLIILSITTSILVGLSGQSGRAVTALPVQTDVPEEILRTEIILTARSPIDGKVLTPAEYAELQAQIQISPPPRLSSGIRDKIFLLELRKTLLQLFPFLPI
ncbi:hypothetical protein MEO40_22780 [Dolichospermum sp. ST_sed1]|nr:hypothetical protein [Dolichospermum sp. ST_sed1]MDD1427471.1 hypothetical protein [Dolichospermum sp. ST_sed9]MDD1433906.1 hypothetical protein [Dolichospermum sp. ST_sed6]MDD1437323.1 hypothetical protein [Dolichospermum sp. ST_sed10]MDD1443264.1 hypothetical protein [Dolichospermum sp. ST_sed3]MDD1448921.1 hypothetical protein [Dolichospermum sp. ST_sed8]MDD1457228.1 hypothetical protein [Dolichospermum sp. ST_sed7]MDD1462961.1 hypothetical protein [Dolichospermum sp. ST_sed2]MDD14664